MKRRVVFGLVVLAGLCATGCLNVSVVDAFSTGVFDFLSGAVSTVLTDALLGPTG
jgi:outer membrane murein-binding lipoprotein Lpp